MAPSIVHAWKKIDEVPFDFERRRISVLAPRTRPAPSGREGCPRGCHRVVDTHKRRNRSDRRIDAEARARLVTSFESWGRMAIVCLRWPPGHAAHQGRRHHRRRDRPHVRRLSNVRGPAKREAAQSINAITRRRRSKILTGDNERITRHICETIGVPVTGFSLATTSTASRRRPAGTPAALEHLLPSSPTAEGTHPSRLEAVGQNGRLPRRRHQRCPALHAADVGISVDTAADVAKEAADMVQLEHDLNVLHDGNIEGPTHRGKRHQVTF